MKTIGLVGGTTWVSTIEYYRLINEMVNERMGGVRYARCLMYSFDFHDIAEFNKRQDWEAAGRAFLDAARKLEQAGAGCILLCANTAHVTADYVKIGLSVPLLHIGEATVREVQQQKLNTVGLLGTKFTMEMDFIKKKFTEQNIEVVIPPADARKYIQQTIFEELGRNIFKEETKREYQKIIRSLAAEGAQGVVLGCTEIPLLIKQNDVNIPVFDTTRIHSRAAVEFALGE